MTMNTGKSRRTLIVILLLVLLLSLSGMASAQTGAASARTDANAPQPAMVTIPAGTRVLLVLTSPLHTTSAIAGSGVYSETAAAVVQDSHIAIPLRAQVQGVVESEKRPGRVKGKAQFLLHFTTLIFPNNYVVPIDGALQSVPGTKVRPSGEKGTLEPVDQIDKDVKTVVKPALIGGAVGSIRSLGPGTFTGAGAGALAGLAKVLFTRGDEIHLPAGTTVEMVLQRPLTLDLNRVR